MDNEAVNLGPSKKVAKILAQKLIKNAEILRPPVSLQRIIEYLQQKHKLDVQHARFSDKVSGLLIVCKKIDQEYATIIFNENHPWCRRRFTIGHEIGHLLMGHTCSQKQGDGSNHETEANNFASELLIPTKFIKEDFSKTPSVPALAKLYRVSGEAISYKLISARLLS